MPDDRPGTASFTKAEPSATDAARLRQSLSRKQKVDLRRMVGGMVRSRSAAIHDTTVDESTEQPMLG